MSRPTLRIVADAHIWGVQSAFAALPGYDVDLSLLEQQEISRERLKDADILLTRSSTKVNAALLEGSSVRFAATATIGDDHYDKAWLDASGIAWANAAGSSTGSVIEYMTTALLELHQRGVVSIPGSKLGIVGVGRIGGALAKVCGALGMQTLLNDPPRARVEPDGDFVSLQQLLAEADVITLHTPLIRTGDDQTLHLVNAEFLARFQGRGIINAARGVCVDNHALADWLDGGKDRFALLDCWEGEPHISKRLLLHPQLVIATPHIAGHSLDGKAANTEYVYRALCEYLSIEPVWNMACDLPLSEDACEVVASGELWRDLHAMATTLYPIMADDRAMRGWGLLADSEMVKAFAAYRRHYPVRRGWDRMGVKLLQLESPDDPQTTPQAIAEMAHRIGIHLLGSGS